MRKIETWDYPEGMSRSYYPKPIIHVSMRRTRIVPQALMFLCLALSFAQEVSARAGLPGGGMRKSTVYVLGGISIVAVLTSIALAVWTARKHHQAKRLAELLAHYDYAWDLDRIKDRISRAFYAIQRAWGDGDLSAARSFMS